MKHIDIRLSTDSITQAMRELRKEKTETKKKMDLLCRRLADIGVEEAQVRFSTAIYDGLNDVKVRRAQKNDGYVVVASGQAVAFIEFGAGIRYGGGYPQASMAYQYSIPGSWSDDPSVGKGHWDDPFGWYYAHGEEGHTYGNPPNQAMWYAREEMCRKIEQIAREVFQ